MKLKKAIKKLQQELENDEEYRNSWKANIAVAFIDEYSAPGKGKGLTYKELHAIANEAADRFLNNLCNR